ncbi:MAG: hypothetical protein KA764_07400 [Anaerolineales bacterium]|nr:hypothetical protein [Anaerolineales bacterium]
MRRARRWLALPLLLLLAAGLVLAAWLWRWIGLGEAAVILAALTLAFLLESARYILRAFLKGYRKDDPR